MNMRFWLPALTTASLLSFGSAHAQSPDDPFEPFNRVTYYVNNVLDRMYIKPAMVVYDTVLPMPAKASVENFYSNVGTVVTMINDALQFKIKDLIIDTTRFAINSTLGLAGLFDVATPMGIQPHRTDLGQTFYAWGWKNSAYCVVPLIGPSTVRDGIGLLGELWLWPISYLQPKWRNRSYALALINRRYVSRDLESLIGVAGVENYELVRSGYMQNREFKLTDGKSVTHSQQSVDMLGEPPD